MNCYDEKEWDGDTPKKADDPYAPNEYGLAGGQGHTTKELEFSAAVCAFGCLMIALLVIGIRVAALINLIADKI